MALLDLLRLPELKPALRCLDCVLVPDEDQPSKLYGISPIPDWVDKGQARQLGRLVQAGDPR